MPDLVQVGVVKIPDPFITTYLLSNKEEDILHFTGFRLRVTGVGNLLAQFTSIDSEFTQSLVSIPLATVTAREPFRLANFNQQRALLRLGTSEINEYFRINRIVIFAKKLWSDYPA